MTSVDDNTLHILLNGWETQFLPTWPTLAPFQSFLAMLTSSKERSTPAMGGRVPTVKPAKIEEEVTPLRRRQNFKTHCLGCPPLTYRVTVQVQ